MVLQKYNCISRCNIVFISVLVLLLLWDRCREMGPNAYIIKFPTRNRNVTFALKCMHDMEK